MNEDISEERIRESFFKSKIGDGVFALFFYRPIAYILYKKVLKKPVSPNKITFVGFIMLLIAAFSLVAERFIPLPFLDFLGFSISMPLLWLILFLFTYNTAMMLDSLDGAIARAFRMGSPRGRLIDSFVDGFGNILLFLALTLKYPDISLWIALMVLAYLTYTEVGLSYMTEVSIAGSEEYSVASVRMIRGFPIKIVFGSPDYFGVGIQIIVLAHFLNIFPDITTLFFSLGWFAYLIVYFVFKTWKIKSVSEKHTNSEKDESAGSD